MKARAARKLQQVPGRIEGCVWTTALMGPRCCDRLSCWLESEPVKTFRQGYRRTWVVRAMEQPMSTKLQHEFGLAVSSVLSCRKRDKIKRLQKLDAGFRAEENRKRRSLPTDLGSSGRSASATKKLRKAEDRKGQQRRWEHPSQAKQ